jgi:hypothetical protein
LDSYGAIWTQRENKGLARFHEGQWHAIEEVSPSAFIEMMAPGSEGRMIIQTGNNCYYWKCPPMVTAYSSLKELVTDNVDDVTMYYTHWPRSATTNIYNYSMGLVADQAGYIWLLESGKLSVLIDGHWRSCETALRGAGSRSGMVAYLNRIGGNGTVYVSDLKLRHDDGMSFYGTVESSPSFYGEDYQPVFTEAPHSIHSTETRQAIRDANDALWIAGSTGYAKGSGASWCDVTTGQLALRMKNSESIIECENRGWAYFCDLSGNVWLTNIWGQGDNMFNIWWNGSIVASVKVPYATANANTFFSDAIGSVYIWTIAGLYHLTADETSHFTDYHINTIYNIEGLKGRTLKLAYSAQGYLVISTRLDTYPRIDNLNLIPFPNTN